METDSPIPGPFQFNPLKHHLGFIRQFAVEKSSSDNKTDVSVLLKDIRHIGTSVMDVYTGALEPNTILVEILKSLESKNLASEPSFEKWAGKGFYDYKIIILNDGSEWTLKYHNDRNRYIHLFPARESPHTFRIKANTLKSAILYYVLIGKDYILREDLNKARKLLGLSPVKDCEESEAITRLIEKLRI
jgi:hypothetical protein